MKRGPGLRGVLGLFGGVFDPVHHGHLRTAFELKVRLGIERVHFIPVGIPPHRSEPEATAEQRVAMLEAALMNEPGCVVDRRELDRVGPSYTIDTVQSFRGEYPDHVLCLLLGMDAFLGLLGWRDWRGLLDLVNLIVARRPGARLPESGELAGLLADRRVMPAPSRAWARAGEILIQDVTQLEISSTDLRASIHDGIEPKYLVPAAVWNIIESSQCYAG